VSAPRAPTTTTPTRSTVDTYLAVASRRDWRSYANRPVPEDVQRRILDGGRLAGSSQNRQPWTFLVVEDSDAKDRLAETVYASANIRTSAFAIAIATPEGKYPLDVGRAMQNMFVVAWNEGVASCPNGTPDAAAAARVLGLEEGLLPVNIPSFGYPRRPVNPEERSAEDWSADANRKPLEEIVRRP
jgi:nitroreductase